MESLSPHSPSFNLFRTWKSIINACGIDSCLSAHERSMLGVLPQVELALGKKKWDVLMMAFQSTLKKVDLRLEKEDSVGFEGKRLPPVTRQGWRTFKSLVRKVAIQVRLG